MTDEMQRRFGDAVCRVFESPGSTFEILERNVEGDPFEPDLTVMDGDEWVFRVVCCWYEEVRDGRLRIFPDTFGMRKRVTDHDDRPTYIVIGAEGTPERPRTVYFTRFFSIGDSVMEAERMREHIISCFRSDFFTHLIRKDFERIFSA